MTIVRVHIGFHKTGTTAIQRSLRRSEKGLVESGVLALVPPDGHDLARGFRSLEFMEKRPKHPGLAESGRLTPEAVIGRSEEIRRSIAAKAADFDCVVLSSEVFSVLDDVSVGQFAEWVFGFADAVEIYAYVRNPVLWAESWFDQRVKLGRFPTEMATPIDAIPRQNDGTSHLDLTGSLPQWLSHFGDVHLRLFDRDTLLEGNVVRDFSDSCDLPALEEPTEDPNQMLGARAATFLCELRPHLSITERAWRPGAAALRGTDKVVFSENQRQRILDDLEESTELAARLLPSGQRERYRKLIPAEQSYPASLTSDDRLDMTGRFIDALPAPGRLPR